MPALAIELISLRKLMQLILASDQRRTSLLRANITEELRRRRGGAGEGGDFHSPFWADAKRHATGEIDLREVTAQRVAAHPGRARLYPELTTGFLTWWEERRRRRNEPFRVEEGHIKGRLILDGLGTIKVENNLAFAIGDDGYRVIYPYFCENPEMAANVARLGLWAMSTTLPAYNIQDLRVLDVLRSSSFSIIEAPQVGNEETQFREQYSTLLTRWNELRREYEP